MRLAEVSGATRARPDGPLKLAVPRGALFEGTLDLLLDAACFVGIAGDQVLPGFLLTDLAHGVFLTRE